VVELLLVRGADINTPDLNGNTPLHWAVIMGQSNIVKQLVDTMADLNVKGVGGKSPLHLAVQQGFVPIAELLLKAGADPNAKADNGETPLSSLIRHNRGREVEKRKDIEDLLRKYGAKE
jgi:ankyrin repeat protein